MITRTIRHPKKLVWGALESNMMPEKYMITVMIRHTKKKLVWVNIKNLNIIIL